MKCKVLEMKLDTRSKYSVISILMSTVSCIGCIPSLATMFPFSTLAFSNVLVLPKFFSENHILGLKISILFSICTRLIYVLQFDLYLHMTGLSLSLGMPFSPAIGCFIERNIAIIAAGGRSHNLIIKIGDRFPRASRSSFW